MVDELPEEKVSLDGSDWDLLLLSASRLLIALRTLPNLRKLAIPNHPAYTLAECA